jgi:hypothetical protein
MLVLRDGQPALTSRAEFGPPPAVASTPSPAPQPLAAAQSFDQRPRDKELVGVWREGDREFRFTADGRVFRKRGGGETEVARWWYDFPDDLFEDEKATGKGQLRWNDSGEVADLRLDDRKATSLTLQGKAKPRRLAKVNESAE